MRLSKDKINFIKQCTYKHLSDCSIYLFGSRVFDDKKGGDIDILVLGKTVLADNEKRKIKIEFQKKFGEQKIDIVNFTYKDKDNFKKLILDEAIQL